MRKSPDIEIKCEEVGVASRRKFLQKLFCGSFAVLSGSEIAQAAVHEVIYPGRKWRSSVSHSLHSAPKKEHSLAHHSQHSFNSRSPVFGAKTLAFEHTHTGDKLHLTYFERGRYIKEALHEINYLLRDFRTDDVHPIDIALLDQLFSLKQMLGVSKPFHIISGYRSPKTNSNLRRHSHGVAEHSFHMQGRAIDIRLERVPLKNIRNAALTLAQGGVGYYPDDGFIHLDTGNVRTW